MCQALGVFIPLPFIIVPFLFSWIIFHSKCIWEYACVYKSIRQGQTCRVYGTITIALSGLPVEATGAQLTPL